jgi:hypothetical protein
LPWSFDGYGEPLQVDDDSVLEVMTPAPVLAALRSGYRSELAQERKAGP